MSIQDIRPLIPDTLMFVLCQTGKTIQMLEDQTNRKYLGDGSQNQYQDKLVWHSLSAIREFIATKLKINPKYWGKGRISEDFHKMVYLEIDKLRKKGIIHDWNRSKQFGIFRLVTYPKKPILDPAINITRTDSTILQTDSSVSQDLKQNFVSILTRGTNDTTYKFALARALLDYCQEHESNSTQTYNIPYTYLSQQFLKYYWHQISVFKIKQDFHVKKIPFITQIINEVFEEDPAKKFRDLDKNNIKRAKEKILKKIFGRGRSSNVIPAFQRLKSDGNVRENKLFYDYNNNDQVLYLKPQAFEFFSKNYSILFKAVLLQWVKFLEKTNTCLPKMIAKIERDNLNSRGSLSEYKTMYLEHTNDCFYCCKKLEKEYIHVDHFIPWSYIHDNNAWNLVLACSTCNCKKSDSLAQEEFLLNLVKRNQKYKDRISRLNHSLTILDIGKGWRAEIESNYNNCKRLDFGMIALP